MRLAWKGLTYFVMIQYNNLGAAKGVKRHGSRLVLPKAARCCSIYLPLFLDSGRRFPCLVLDAFHS